MFTTRPEIAGTFGVVASTHWIASQVGMAVLERGGNAFDAAAATAFTLQVAEPHLNGPGGDAPIILHSARTQTQQVICGQGVAPQAATLAKFRELDIDLIPGDRRAARGGARRVRRLVPAAARLGHLGTRRRARLRDRLCEERHPCRAAHQRATIESVRALFETEWKSSAAVFLPGGKVPAPESLFARPALAETYERICREAVGDTREARIDAARGAWYRGFVAEAVDKFFRSTDVLDVTGRRHRGLLAADDFARWSATVEDPVAYDYNGHTVLKCGPWSQGPVFLQQLALLRGFDIGAMDPFGNDFVHTVVECAKLAYADREAYYGDPNFCRVPLGALLSDDYNAERRKLVGRDASLDLRPGHGARPHAGGRSRRRRPRASADPGAGRRRADRGAARRDRRRHLPSRRDRQGRQHGQRDAVRRLAAILAGDPGTRLLHGNARADVLAEAGPAQQPGTRQAPAHHAVAELRAARRQAVDGVRHAGRRAAGPVGADLLPAHGASQHGHPGGDRRAVVPHRALAVELLAARARVRGRWCWKAATPTR